MRAYLVAYIIDEMDETSCELQWPVGPKWKNDFFFELLMIDQH